MIRVDEHENYGGREKKKIENKEGWYVEKYDLIDKYLRRDLTKEASKSLRPAQFFKMYDTFRGGKLKPESIEDHSESEDGGGEEVEKPEHPHDRNHKFHYLMTSETPKKPIPLLDVISLQDPYPGEAPLMKKRKTPAVLRFHKPKQNLDPASYFFSEALLYTSFTSEEELELRVENAAADGYKELEKEINSVKSQVMEFLVSNQEARVDEALKKVKKQ